MANSENLKPIKKGQLTKEEAKRRGSNGGKKSVIKRKEYKAYRIAAEMALVKLLNAGAMDSLTDIEEFEKLSTKDKLAILEHLRDSSGQKPIDKQLNVEGTKEDLEIVIDKESIQKEIEKTRMLADE